MKARILAADIGATSSRFASFSLDSDGTLKLNDTVWLATQGMSSFAELLQKLDGSEFSLPLREADVVALGVAGPVERGEFCSPPFISWDIDLSRAESDYGIKRFALINDFVAQAFACPSPVGQNAEQILPRTGPEAGRSTAARCRGTVSVVGAGSNLGKALLLAAENGGFLAIPSEGGHVSFPAESEREAEFAEFAVKKLEADYLTCNNVVSGKGIALIHEFLTGEHLEPPEITSKWSDLSTFDESSETLLWASRFYGRVCRNFALDTLSQSGVFIAGGVAAKAPVLVKHDVFMKEFQSSPSHGELLRRIPVYLMTNEESGLWGAAFAGTQKLEVL